MENDALIIRNRNQHDPKSLTPGPLDITMKEGFDETALYHAIVVIMDWARSRHKVNSQLVMDAIKEKEFLNEHIYNPLQKDWFDENS